MPGHCISEAQSGVQAACALLQAAMISLNEQQYSFHWNSWAFLSGNILYHSSNFFIGY